MKIDTTPQLPFPEVKTSAIPNFADLMAEIPSWTDWPKKKRENAISALRITARKMVRRHLALIPASTAFLTEQIKGRTAAEFGMGPRRKENVLSQVRAVMRKKGLHAPDSRKAVLSPAWAGLVAQEKEPGRKACLKRFGAWCTTAGIESSAVTDATVVQYAAEDEASRLTISERSVAGRVVYAMNVLISQGAPGAPAQPLATQKQRVPYTLPLTSYPESLQQEVRSFLGRLGEGGRRARFLTSRTGPKKALRPSTIKTRAFAIRQMLGVLVQLGHRPESITSLLYLFEPLNRAEDIVNWLDARQQRDGEEEVLGGQLATITETMRQLAVHVLKLDTETCATLSAWASEARPERDAGLTPKNRERLRALVQPKPYALYLDLPLNLMERARSLDGSPAEAARLAMLAVMIEILSVFPMRLENLSKLHLDHHLKRPDPRARRISHIELKPHETKNKKLITWPIARETGDLIEEYIQKFRPAIAEPECPFLFPGMNRRDCRSNNAVSDGIVRIVAEEVGVRINVHLLRHFAAYLFLKRNPGQYGVIQKVLGHKDLSTTMTFYVAFDEEACAQKFDETFYAERRATRIVALAARRKPAKHTSRNRRRTV